MLTIDFESQSSNCHKKQKQTCQFLLLNLELYKRQFCQTDNISESFYPY